MKKKNLKKKLILSKETITNLNMEKIIGGGLSSLPYIQCVSFAETCDPNRTCLPTGEC